jgi:hypothetical protein
MVRGSSIHENRQTVEAFEPLNRSKIVRGSSIQVKKIVRGSSIHVINNIPWIVYPRKPSSQEIETQRVLANWGVCQTTKGANVTQWKARRDNHIAHAIERVC